MSLILHLSDLHLGPASPGQRDYDDKFGMDPDEGETETDHLEHTLEALGRRLVESGNGLDAIVVTGDITKGNHTDGYRAFPPLLELLGDAMPAEDKVVVIPGNHDVDRDLQPGDRAKLARFMDATRPRYSTPLVKGLDYKSDNLHLNPGARGRPKPVVDLGDAVVVAINSADYCWTKEQKTKTDWDAVLAAYLEGDTGDGAEETRKRAAEELKKLRTHDIPKVDKKQIDALKKRLDVAKIGDDADRDPRLRIAAIHHPITPATDQEEIKPFEVITNLAIVRTFLYRLGFHLVLHGHKHTSYAAWDWLAPPRDDLEIKARRAMVLGAPGRFRVGGIVCRLIEVSPEGEEPVAGAPRVRIVPIKGVDAAESMALDIDVWPKYSLAQPAFTSANPMTPWVIEAETADAAYEQVRDLALPDPGGRPVVSVVNDPASTADYPTNYPDKKIPRLGDLVDWWQLPRPEAVSSYSGSTFNHGERLYGGEDSVDRAVAALPSSKAFALLVRSGEAGSEAESPAFLEVQLQTRSLVKGRRALDVIGVYRKQDLNLWWPVNMAELARIQAKAVATANDLKHLEAEWEPGRLSAIAMQGVHDDVLPQMAGTLLDRAVDLRPEWIYRLAYLAAVPDSADEDAEVLTEWGRALGDIGDRPPKGLLVPSVGIERLCDALDTHPASTTTPEFRALTKSLGNLRQRARSAEDALAGKNPNGSTLDGWATQLKEAAGDCEKALRKAVRAALRS
ncbi:MAG: metallophosphoesterase [Actinobacteria bacterium]|nr:metallophosphoesterase [Actinomycetota bacterium]